MNIEKSYWVTQDDNMYIRLPLSKVDKVNRLVSGWATLDNVDKQKDKVLATASKKAFDRFHGNIREMHQNVAVGRMADFKEEDFYDKASGKTYRGIFVTARVSKGAPNTWEKVLDGTLNAFSIGGKVLEKSVEFSKDADGPVDIIKDYELVELSLVDNPANEHATIVSVVKSEDGLMLKGMLADMTFKNVFWCDHDNIAKSSTVENESCSMCDNDMVNIGWFETGEDEKEMRNIINKYLNKGGVEMSDEKEETPSTAVDTEPLPVVEDEKPEETLEHEEVDLEKVVNALHETFKASIESATTATSEALQKFEGQVAEISKLFENKFKAVETKLDGLTESLDALKSVNGDVSKRLDSLETETAFRKSAVLESPGGSGKEDSFWKGTFISVDD